MVVLNDLDEQFLMCWILAMVGDWYPVEKVVRQPNKLRGGNSNG